MSSPVPSPVPPINGDNEEEADKKCKELKYSRMVQERDFWKSLVFEARHKEGLDESLLLHQQYRIEDIRFLAEENDKIGYYASPFHFRDSLVKTNKEFVQSYEFKRNSKSAPLLSLPPRPGDMPLFPDGAPMTAPDSHSSRKCARPS